MHLPAPASATDDRVPPIPAGRADGSLLTGSWAAVRWEYARPDGSVRVDVIDDLGGTVTLSVGDGTYVLSCELPEDGPRSASGSLRVTADQWIDFMPLAGTPERVGFSRASGTLALRSEHSAWDFGGGGEERADFTAVMVRL